MPHDGISPKLFFEENFKVTIGKVYSPYPPMDGKPIFMLALLKERIGDILPDHLVSPEGQMTFKEKAKIENAETLRLLETAFYVTEPLALGEDPSEELAEMEKAHPVRHGPAYDGKTGVQVVSGVKGGLKSAVDRSGWCPCPAAQCPNPESVRLLVLPHTMGANLYRVIPGTLRKNMTFAGIKRLACNAFNSVDFPTMTCHIWRVDNVDG